MSDTTLILGNQPKEDIKVNKEYDENGYLIRYDSTYTYYYSNIEGDEIVADSIWFFVNFGESMLNNYTL